MSGYTLPTRYTEQLVELHHMFAASIGEIAEHFAAPQTAAEAAPAK